MMGLENKFAPLIPLIPALMAGMILISQGIFKNFAAYMATAAVAVSGLLGYDIFFRVLGSGSNMYHDEASFTWLSTGGTPISFGIMIDGMTAVMLVVVTTVSLLVHIFSIGYMHGDPRFSRFFGFLNLFTASMLSLVLANNLLLLFISWELVGLCSYLLIGFWFEKHSAANASKKAFITTKVADSGIMLALMAIFAYVGSFNFTDIKMHLVDMPQTWALALGFLLFLGAMGKSAQIPLHIWLPDAMEGPTPVSALIHAATMVVAGVYLVARMNFLFSYSPAAGTTVAVFGVLTAFVAASIALTANDIKKVLAYSTVSQLGYMMTALGLGAVTAGMFHLFTHAFFKALLFLGSGSVIHGAGTQDMRLMGGLSKKMPQTAFTMFVACLAIAGIFPLAGYFSKDEILLAAYQYGQSHGLWIYVLGTGVAAMTAFYMWRLFFMTFTGKTRDPHMHAHESPLTMTGPLWILCVLSIVAGMWGAGWGPFAKNGAAMEFLVPKAPKTEVLNWKVQVQEPGGKVIAEAKGVGESTKFDQKDLHPVSGEVAPMESKEGEVVINQETAAAVGESEHAEHAAHTFVARVSTLVAVLGIFLAILIYGVGFVPQDLFPNIAPGVTAFLQDKWRVDEFFAITVVQPVYALSRACSKFDANVVDGAVNLSGAITIWTSKQKGKFDLRFVDGAVNLSASVTQAMGSSIRRVQTGLTQNYFLIVTLGFLILAGVTILLT